MVGGCLEASALHSYSAGCVSLRISINEQRPLFRDGEARGKINGSRCLSDAALLIRNCYDAGHVTRR